jgi:hypothetical protein
MSEEIKDITAEDIVVGAVLDRQVVPHRRGYWPATVTLSSVKGYEPRGMERRVGDIWLKCEGLAELDDGRLFRVASTVLISNGYVHATWERQITLRKVEDASVR